MGIDLVPLSNMPVAWHTMTVVDVMGPLMRQGEEKPGVSKVVTEDMVSIAQ